MHKVAIDEIGKVYIASECYVMKGDEVLLFKRSETASKFPGFWIGPGGHVDKGEDALTAAIREVKEETGVVVDESNMKLKAIAYHHHIDRNEVWVATIYLARIDSYETTYLKDEHEGKGVWLKISKANEMENVFPPAKFYFEHVLNDKPGILYTNIEWSKSQLVKVNSVRIDKNY